MLTAMGRVCITSVTASLLLAAGCSDFADADAGTDAGSGTSAMATSDSTGVTSMTTADAADGTATSNPTSTGSSSESGSETTAATSTGSSSGERATGPYPVVLAHGFFGFEDFAGAGFVDYFWNVREDLAEIGETEVFTPPVDPFNDSTTRGLQLLAAVEAVVEETGAEKVNIIGHSQGGLDARVVAHMRPDLVASVTTVSTPHGGTPIADYALLIPGGGVIDVLLQLFGGPLWGEIDGNTSLIASMEQFSDDGIAAFNETYTDAPGVVYVSIAGRSDNELAVQECAAADAPPFIANWDGVVDPIDPLFAASEAIVDGGLLSSIPNDGLVRVDDAKWGTFLGCIPADHIDQIGHLFGDGSGGNNPFDHLAFYRNLVGYLRARGF
ncbi:MAG: alpha/beta fold hydrolase [Myxococcota bacterium]